MNRPISAESHFLSKDIQFHTHKYFGCPTVTNSGQTCRSSFTTNRFIDQTTGKQFNCNWYCLRNCSPEKLLPILKNIPKYALSNQGDNMLISSVNFDFKTKDKNSSENYDEYIIIKVNSINEEWKWIDFKRFGRIGNPQYLQQLQQQGLAETGTQLIKLANQLCKWFRLQDPGVEIQVKCQAVLKMWMDTNTSRNEKKIKKLGFSGFDKPFFQPTKEWSNDGTAIVTPFLMLNQGEVLPTQEKMNESKSSPEPISWADHLPINLAEEDPLISYGVAHPRLHHIPRKYRQASRHRPRHFHSPVRKIRSRK